MCRFIDNGALFYLLSLFCLFTSCFTYSLVPYKDMIKRVIHKQYVKELRIKSEKFQYESHKSSFILQQRESRKDIPKFFDSRKKWPMCKGLRKARNHKMCGAGWAFAAAATMSDRLCIQSDGQVNIDLSVEELISCCKNCGGCNIGNSMKAWQFWINEGLVSGGDYDGSFEGCKPYSESTAHYGEVSVCKNKCESDYNISYQEDKYFGASVFTMKENISQIQIDIMTNGPVQAGLEVYDDFFTYKKGIYRHETNTKYMGYTHVKLLGWGEERNVPYWLGVTSWGSDFGGFFKILRGKNEAGIEANIIAGQARIFHSASPTISTIAPPTSICSISIMLKVSSWAFIVTISSIFFSFFSIVKKKINFYERLS